MRGEKDSEVLEAQAARPGNGKPAEDASPDGSEDVSGGASADTPDPTPAQDEAGLEPVEPDLAAQLAQAQREQEELHDRFLRQGAEFHNYRKRVARERELAVLDARAGVLERLLPIVDNLERALAAEFSDASLHDGVELVHRELLGMLETEGVRVEDPEGLAFDPERHEALAHEPVPGHEEGTVVEVFRKGYLLGDRLLRPALVKVAKGEETEPAGGGGPQSVH